MARWPYRTVALVSTLAEGNAVTEFLNLHNVKARLRKDSIGGLRAEASLFPCEPEYRRVRDMTRIFCLGYHAARKA